MRLSVPSPSLAAAFAALALAGCGGNVDFSITRTFDVDSSVAGGRASDEVNLAADAGRAWKERKHIDRITIRGATAEVVSVNAGITATSITGTVWLHETNDANQANWVQVGPRTATLQAGELLVLDPSPQLDDFLLTQLRNDGQFTIVAEGTTTGGARVAATLRVTIDATLKWKAL
jgi:hypothetical protein